MENNDHIKNLVDVLEPFLDHNVSVLGSRIKRLTSAGDNFGSQMFAVDLDLQNQKLKKKEKLHLVAKTVPPTEFLKEMFHTAISFKKEINVYTTIFPTLRAFQREQDVSNTIDCIPECYGARLNLNPNSDEVDDEALLLLENLQLSGFKVVDRMKGFDLETAELIIKDLAVFHAVPIALKLLRPKVFNEKILPHLSRNRVFDTVSEGLRKSIIELVIQTSKLNQECLPFITNIEEGFNLGFNNIRNSSLAREPFATINHNDFWVNNTMLKFENNKPVQNKMIDFQVIDYGSPGKDIVFFLFSSVQGEVVDKHYDNLIKLYYDTFICTLKNLKCDIKSFTFELLTEEINVSAKCMEFFHVMVMLKHVLALKGKAKELTDLTEEDLIAEELVSDEYKKKIPETVLRFAKRKWI